MSANTARQKGVYIGILFFFQGQITHILDAAFCSPGRNKAEDGKKSVIGRERRGGKEKYIGGISERES